MTHSLKSHLAVLVLCFSASVADVQADNVNLPVVELLGGNYYVYKAKKGDSLFGIARMFNWDDQKLQELNPSAVSPLQKGMKIYYPAESYEHKTPVATIALPQTGELLHDVKRGETVYAISNMYGVSVDRIYSLNPDSRNGIKAGEKLVIRAAGNEMHNNVNNPSYHTVRSGDTLFGLAREYGVSVAAILKNNPGIDEKNFRTGINIKIPVRGAGIKKTKKIIEESNLDSVEIHKVGKKETWNSIASENGISVDVLKDANPEVSELKNKEFIAIPRVETVKIEKDITEHDPREESEQGIAEIYQDVHGIGDNEIRYTVRVAVVSEDPSSKRDIEFLRGFLVGLEKQKNDEYGIEFKVIDGTASSESVITALDGFKPAAVFITADHDMPDYIWEYASVSQTPVINSFDVKSTEYVSNPYAVQLLAPSALFNENIAGHIFDRFSDRTLVLAGQKDSNDLLAESLIRLWDPARVKTSSVEDIKPESFAENGKYLVYSYPVKKGEVNELLGNTIRCRDERPLADISFIGRPNLILFEESLAQSFHKANVMIPSRFYIDRESEQYKEFISGYRSLFNRAPVKSLPLYAAVGYDTSVYFISGLAQSRGDINKMTSSTSTVQSDYDLVRTSSWGGFMNPPVFLIEFTPYDTIEKKVISYGE